ncbi:MAG: PfkB family carbohydrate kinase [Verrucomicrobiota bacterium JB022]|nr:PfkB family carbohydrate kinase [Verrucomicrobiota bacterium JB022]
MAHLITLTGNLLAETTAYYRSANWGRTQRAYQESFQVGGKGINVSRMAERLGLETTAYCFTGGFIGQKCEAWLEAQPFAYRAFGLGAENRQGWVARVDDRPDETTFMGQDRPVPFEAWKKALAAIAEERPGWIALCGSMPGWDGRFTASLQEAMEALQPQGVRFALDCYGAPLEAALELPFDLLKINRDEWRGMAEARSWHEDPRYGLEAVHEAPVRRWIITDGGNEVLFCDDGRALYRLNPPRLEQMVSPVGSGDVTLAALLAHLEQGESWPAALAEAMRYGAVNAGDAGVAAFDLEAVRTLALPRVERLS